MTLPESVTDNGPADRNFRYLDDKRNQFATAQAVASGGGLTLTTTPTDVPGATYTTTVSGSWLVMASVYFIITVTGIAAAAAVLVVDGVAQTPAAVYNDSGTGFVTASQNWLVPNLAAGKVMKLQGSKLIAAGTAAIGNANTTLTFLRLDA